MNFIDKILLEAKELLTEKVLNLFTSQEKEKYVDEVWNLLQSSYASIGGIKGSGFESKEDMIKKIEMWKLYKRNGKISCVILYKNKNGFRKRVAGATDGSAEGKAFYKQSSNDELKTKRSYGEISGAPLAIAYKNNKEQLLKALVPFEEVKKYLPDDEILPSNDKYLETYPDLEPFLYQREIGGTLQTKVMLGKKIAMY